MFYPENETQQLLRVGVISSVDPATCTAKVLFEDRDDIVTDDLKIVVPHTVRAKFYGLPEVGEQVLCAFLQNGIETGFILGSIYSEADKPPLNDKNKKGVWFEDGTSIQYDEKAALLTINAKNPITIEGDFKVSGTVEAPLFKGNLQGSVSGGGS